MSQDDIATYYDRNTHRFLRYGGSGEAAAIHRQIWAPGVTTPFQAFTYLNQSVLAQVLPILNPGEQVIILDLGCGVGGTATWLAQHRPEWADVQVVGVSNSAVQVALASQRAANLGLAHRCTFRQMDFLNLVGLGLAPASCAAAYAIESFTHTLDAASFFREVFRWLKPGGRLILCDDFKVESTPHRAQPWLNRFELRWHLNSLLSVEQVLQQAQACGFKLVELFDLTGYLRGFPAAVLYPLAWLTSLPMRGKYWDNLAGGSALQICQRRGWLRYATLVLERQAVSTVD